MLVRGLLQTAEYARALFIGAGISEERASVLAGARLERQAIFQRADPAQVSVVIDETALRRLIGSPEIMADQLDRMATVAELVNVSLHVLPATGANAGLFGTFTLANGESVPDTLILDSIEDRVTQDRGLVRRASVVFDLVRRDALSRVQSHDALLRVAEEWKTRQA